MTPIRPLVTAAAIVLDLGLALGLAQTAGGRPDPHPLPVPIEPDDRPIDGPAPDSPPRQPIPVPVPPTPVPVPVPTPVPGSGFDPATHGFSFANTGRDVCFTIVGADKLRYDPNGPFCGSEWGLCGGMSLLAGERFLAGKQSAHLTWDQARKDIINAQFRTLDPRVVNKFLGWIASPDEGHWHDRRHSVGYMMGQDWNDAIRPRLDDGEPVVLGLIFDKRAKLSDLRTAGALADLTSQHQVLAYDYRKAGSGAIELLAYDPNYPGDTLLLTFRPGEHGTTERLASGASLSSTRTAKPPRAVMYVRGVSTTAIDRVCPTGKFTTYGEHFDCSCERGTKKYGGVASSHAWCEGGHPCPAGLFSTTSDHRGCYCETGTKKYGGVGSSHAWCSNAAACPTGKFKTTGEHRGCKCERGTKKYSGVGNSRAWCEGATTCPSGKFKTTGEHRGCKCPAGKTKHYSGLFKRKAKCK